MIFQDARLGLNEGDRFNCSTEMIARFRDTLTDPESPKIPDFLRESGCVFSTKAWHN